MNQMTDMIGEISRQLDLILCNSVRENAVPPIKGVITHGKLKYRGIKLVEIPSKNQKWIEQRGKRISPVIEINATLKIT